VIAYTLMSDVLGSSISDLPREFRPIIAEKQAIVISCDTIQDFDALSSRRFDNQIGGLRRVFLHPRRYFVPDFSNTDPTCSANFCQTQRTPEKYVDLPGWRRTIVIPSFLSSPLHFRTNLHCPRLVACLFSFHFILSSLLFLFFQFPILLFLESWDTRREIQLTCLSQPWRLSKNSPGLSCTRQFPWKPGASS
jgi:hypothetical protein